jgi:murein L,D-transpeptidase YafK
MDMKSGYDSFQREDDFKRESMGDFERAHGAGESETQFDMRGRRMDQIDQVPDQSPPRSKSETKLEQISSILTSDELSVSKEKFAKYMSHLEEKYRYPFFCFDFD